MKLIELRKSLKQQFTQRGIDCEDVDFIIEEVLSVKRTELVLIENISELELDVIMQKVSERLKNKPVSKIFNKAYFYKEEYLINEDVLSPRSDSEILVDTALKYIKQNNYKSVLDLCTGSGCLAIAIRKNSNTNVTASDISKKALEVAKTNAKNLNAEIEFIHSNAFENITKKFDLIVSNPPYIATKEIYELNKEVKDYDPLIALDGGETGLDFYNIIHRNAQKYLNDKGVLIMEIGETQKQSILNIFNDFHFVECVKDYAGLDRVMVFKLREDL